MLIAILSVPLYVFSHQAGLAQTQLYAAAQMKSGGDLNAVVTESLQPLMMEIKACQPLSVTSVRCFATARVREILRLAEDREIPVARVAHHR